MLSATRCMLIGGGFEVERGRRLMRRRGELLERPNAHLYETGGMRRTHLRGHGNILKRLLVHVAACNLWPVDAHVDGDWNPTRPAGPSGCRMGFLFVLSGCYCATE